MVSNKKMIHFLYEVWWYFAVLNTIFYVSCAVLLVRSDCDLLLWLYCIWGRKPKRALSNKVIWITGASSGIGEHLAYALAKCGSILVLSARRENELNRVLQRCKDLSIENGEKHMILPMDLRACELHKELSEKVLKKFGRIDVLVNNAGRPQGGIIVNTKKEVDEDVMDLNFLSTVSLTKAVLPSMVAQSGGSVVMVSSIAGKVPSPGSASYCASKHALQGYCDSLRTELWLKNISVLSICPGPVNTPFLKQEVKEKTNTPKKHKRTGPGDKKLTVERCVHLMTVAMANDLKEVWISHHPILLLTYISQYSPIFFKWLGLRIAQKRIKPVKRD